MYASHSTCISHSHVCTSHASHTAHRSHAHTTQHTSHASWTTNAYIAHHTHTSHTSHARITHTHLHAICPGADRGPQTHLRVPALLLCYRRPPEASGSKGAAWPQAPLRLCTRCSPGPPSPCPSLQLCGGAPPPPPAVPAPASPAPSAWGGLLPLTSSAGAGGGALLQAPHCHARPLSFQPS